MDGRYAGRAIYWYIRRLKNTRQGHTKIDTRNNPSKNPVPREGALDHMLGDTNSEWLYPSKAHISFEHSYIAQHHAATSLCNGLIATFDILRALEKASILHLD